jgi:hypothetical protein
VRKTVLVAATAVMALAGAVQAVEKAPTATANFTIAEAIRAGTENPDTPGGYELGVNVVLTTPFSRVAKAAANAKRKYRPFTPSDVTKEMVEPVVVVTAEGYAPSADIVNNFEHIVVAKGSAENAEAIQPLNITTTTQEHKNRFGMTLATTKGVVASFPLSVLTEGYEFRVIYNLNFAGTKVGDRPKVIPLTSETLAKIR